MTQNKRIAVIGLKGLPAFGGAATVGQNIINQLKGDFDFTVFSVASHAQEDFCMKNVNQIIFKSFPLQKLNVFFYYLKSCFYVLFKDKFDLIHLHHTDAAFILPLLRIKYKVVLTSHARPQDNSKWPKYVKLFFRINESIAIRFSSCFTTVAMPLKQLYEEKYKTQVQYIPNGVDLAIASQVKKNERHNTPYILFSAGRVIPLKGLHLLLDALKKIKYQGKLVVVGNLDQVPTYKDQIINQSKELDVEYVGLITDKLELLSIVKSASLFVFPSLTEAMSIMLLETAMMQVPIICSDITPNKAIFNDSEVEFFKSNDVDDLAVKIEKYYKTPDQINAKVELAYKKLEQEYQWREIAKKYKEMYAKL